VETLFQHWEFEIHYSYIPYFFSFFRLSDKF
jgi:hypothetical protein